MEKKRILFISQEIAPFLPKSEISTTARRLSQGIQETGKEIRVFTPKYGSINERRHQLHEVQRLSGMNIIIDDTDHPLIIKVASIAAARMQVYFIDNEEYFRRKNNLTEEDGTMFADNDERAMFFCHGILKTVKNLGWKPNVIHCHGWFGALMPLYIKKLYNEDPHFADTKVVYSLYNERFDTNWDERFAEKLKFDGFSDDIVEKFRDTSFENIMRMIMQHTDGINVAVEDLDPELRKLYDEATCLKQDFVPEENQNKVLSDFFDKVIEEEVLI